MVLIVLDRSNFSLFVASKSLVIIHSDCVCNAIELMLESILVRVGYHLEPTAGRDF